MEKARIVILTGPGKGKTTSALGMVLRAIAYGKKVLLVRFCKTAFSGEVAILEGMEGVVILGGDHGMPPSREHPEYEAHVACARDLFASAKVMTPEFDMIVLDEICGAVARGMVPECDVLTYLASLRPNQAIVLTGRGAGPNLVNSADTVSDIHCVKHGHQHGIAAQEGIER